MQERAQRRQTSIPGTDGVAPTFFQVVQKTQDAVGRQDPQGQGGEVLLTPLTPVLEQEPEGIAVSGYGGGADITLSRQILLEKALYPFAEVRGFHDRSAQNALRPQP